MRNEMPIAAGLLCFFVLGYGALAETRINKVTYGGDSQKTPPASGMLAPELQLRLKKVFLFPAIDDLSGALAPKLDDKLAELFNANTRFELVRDPQVIKALSPDESTYYKVAQNQSVHHEAAKVTGADTTVLLRTRNVGRNTQMVLELRDAAGSLLFQEEGSVPGASSLEARFELVKKLYQGLLARLPFEGAITGRTANTLTVDLGMGSLKLGEELEIARIVSVQRHPLLGTVVGTDYVRTGKARVTSVDRVLSFAEITEEFSGERVAPTQKILRSRPVLTRGSGGEAPPEPRPGLKQKPGAEEKEPDPFDDRLKGDFDEPRPRYGMGGANLYYGSLTYDQTQSGNATDFSGSGLGGDLNGELWITKNWILAAGYGFHGANLKGAAGSLGSSSWHEFSLVGAYRIFPESLAEGVTLTAGLGYQVISTDIPTSTTLAVGGKRYAGPLIRADGEIGFMDRQKVSVGFGLQPFSSLTETGSSLGSPSGGTVLAFHLGWIRQITAELSFRIGLRYTAANGSYDNASTVANKRFAIGPGIYYSF